MRERKKRGERNSMSASTRRSYTLLYNVSIFQTTEKNDDDNNIDGHNQNGGN